MIAVRAESKTRDRGRAAAHPRFIVASIPIALPLIIQVTMAIGAATRCAAARLLPYIPDPFPRRPRNLRRPFAFLPSLEPSEDGASQSWGGPRRQGFFANYAYSASLRCMHLRDAAASVTAHAARNHGTGDPGCPAIDERGGA